MFISFEGTEGVGKTTLIQALGQWLEQQGKSVIITREPGGTKLAEKIRQLLLEIHDEPMCSHTELLLIYAARVQHLHHVIEPELKQGKFILCDRFIDSSFAYQVAGRHINETTINILNQQFIHTLPTITFWLDAPVELGMQRARQRSQADRFEQEQLDFFTQVRAGYQKLHYYYPNRIIQIHADQDPQHVFAQTILHLQKFL